jgi:ribosomal protein L18E
MRSCYSWVQVNEAMCAAERARAEESIQRDEQFQEAMSTPSVRAVVDAVVADPSMGPHVTVCASDFSQRTF